MRTTSDYPSAAADDSADRRPKVSPDAKATPDEPDKRPPETEGIADERVKRPPDAELRPALPPDIEYFLESPPVLPFEDGEA
jgi:hypothetical protein